jgi:predicted RNA binding protein YcfA (HicA-like mRNA interferase family)
MTQLERPIKRGSRLRFGHYRKRIVVMLHPGDKIAMRLEKSRTWVLG